MTSNIKKTLLLVEDEELIALIEKEQLENEGYKVIRAASGENALQIIFNKKEQIDLILMDIDLGKGIDGTQAAREILKEYDIPIVFLSSHTEKEVVQKTENITSYGYVVKNSGIIVLDASIKMAFKLFDANTRIEKELTKCTLIEDELIKKEETINQIINAVPVFISLVNTDIEYIFANKLYESFFKFKQNEIIGMKVKDVLGDDTYERAYPNILKALSGQSVIFENKLINKDNKTRYIQTTYLPYYKDKKIDGLIILVVDITEIKKNEELLKLDEERLESLLRINQYSTLNIQEFLDYALNEAIKLTESKIGYIYFYDEMNKEFTLNTWSKDVMKECFVLNPQTVYKLEKTGIWGEAVRQRKPIMDNNFTNPDPLKKGVPEGHIKLLKFLTIPVFYEEQIIAVVGVANKETDYNDLDIRQLTLMMYSVWKIVLRIRVEDELKKSEERYSLTMKAVNDGLWDWNVSDGNAFFSELYYKILGYENDEFPANYTYWKTLVHPEDIERAEKELNFCIKSREGFAIDLRMKMKSGKWLWVSTRGKVVERDNDGKALRMAGVLSDITERIRSEEKIKNLLIEKEIILKEVHHRIKNNMNTIYNLLSLQEEFHKDSDAHDILHDAAGRVQSMMVLYDKLYCSEITGFISIKNYLPVLVHEIVSIFPEKTKIKIDYNIDDIVLSEKILSSLGIILNELITNTMKYAFNGLKDSRILLNVNKVGNNIILIFKDNGHGIDKHKNLENSTGLV